MDEITRRPTIIALDSAIAEGGDLSWDAFSETGDFTAYSSTPPDQVISRAKDADAIIVNKVAITAEIISSLPNLKYIGVIATGYDNVDVNAAHKRGITVTNVPDYSSDSVAQTVFALLLETVNHVADFNDEVRRDEWTTIPFVKAVSDPSLRITELAGKTMAVYGLGNIGMRVATIAHAFGMNVISPTSKPTGTIPEWIEKIETTDEMFRRADILSLNAPLTQQSRHIVNKKTLAMMKSSAIIINTARGGLVCTEDLDNALRNNIIRAAALDVLEKEPPEKNNSILSNPHCIVTPHIAWDSLEARARLMEICVRNLKNYLSGNPNNVV